MNGTRRTIVMVVIGVLLAAAIISTVTALEAGNIVPPPPASITTKTSVVTTSSTVISAIPTGKLAVQMADAGNMPIGASNLYISYADIEAHTSNAESPSLWFTIAGPGSVELSSLSNSSMTLGSASASVGHYDQVRITISNATMTYFGANHTLAFPQTQLVATVQNGGLSLNSNASAGIVIELAPTVIQASNVTSNNFALIPDVKAYPIPNSLWNESLLQIGSRISLAQLHLPIAGTGISHGLAVYEILFSKSFVLLYVVNKGNTDATISSVSLIGSPYSITSNTSQTSSVTTVTVTVTVNNSRSSNASSATPKTPASTPAQAMNSVNRQTIASFVVLNDGSMIQVNDAQLSTLANNLGLTLAPGQNRTLYCVPLGGVSTFNSIVAPNSPLAIISGQIYTIQLSDQYGNSLSLNATAF